VKSLALILAGGTGTELGVLTRQRAKSAVPFGGRYRVIDFCLSNCVHSGVSDIAILAQYSPKSLIGHIGTGKPWDLDRRSGGVSILQPTHNGEAANWYLGTADALYQNVDLIRNSKADTILVLSGDQVYGMDYRTLVERHLGRGRDVTLVTKEVPARQRSRFGMVRCSRDGLVTAFREKPTSSIDRFASIGIYAFRREYLLGALCPERVDIVFDIVMPAIRRGAVAAHPFEGYWEDIGSIASYYRASLQLLERRSLIADESRPVYTRESELPPARCSESARVSNSIIADGCIIGGTVRGSILFPGVTVERDALVEDSIVFSFSRIGGGARVRRAILDKFVSVGSGASVGGAVRRAAGRIAEDAAEDVAVVGRKARIVPGASVGRGVSVEPHAAVGRRRKT
jgi:glucose-1-phosphate adenylyltransferase